MTSYKLTLSIDNPGLQTISNAGMSVALLQPQQGASLQIVAMLPAATNNMSVTWSDSLYVFTSSNVLGSYQVLSINSYQQALTGQIYTFNGSTITPTGPTSLPNTVQIENQSGGTVAAGLARVFTVNDQAQPLAVTIAASVLNNGLATFQISTQILLTVMGGAAVGMAIPNEAFPDYAQMNYIAVDASTVTAQIPLLMTFTASNPSQTARFDDLNCQFVTP
nr:hypothetical protein [uncultured Gellertiella sp.]